MLKTYLYVPDQTHQDIISLAKTHQTSKAKMIRRILKTGIKQLNQNQTDSTSILFKINQIGQKNRLKGPQDASTNMDKYLWDQSR